MEQRRFAIFKNLATALLLPAAVFLIGPSASAFPARLGVSPDNNGELLASTLREAKRKIYINIYQLESEEIVAALTERIRDGVTVEILVEGQPLPRVSQDGRKLLLRLHRSMLASKNTAHRIYVMIRNPAGNPRRYKYDHAKYAIVDSLKVLVSSENFKQSGHPIGVGPLVAGNRGWDIVVENKQLASELLSVYRSDVAAKHGDIVRYKPSILPPLADGPKGGNQDDGDDVPYPEGSIEPSSIGNAGRHDRPAGEADVTEAHLVAAPHALPGLTSFLRGAKSSLAVEAMSLPQTWKDSTKQVFTSPLVQEMIDAARRGVRVRILMNDENTFPRPDPTKKKGNELTLDFFQKLVACEKIPLEARIVDVKATNLTYIHNKGMIADGLYTLVSSINGTQNSVEANREMAIAVTSHDAARYYGDVFNSDWVASEKLPLNNPQNYPIQSYEDRLGCKPKYMPELQAVPLLGGML